MCKEMQAGQHSLILGCAAGATAGAQAAPSAGLSAEEMQAAMRSVEDETDAAAAAALEQENAAELAEFTLEPASQVSPICQGMLSFSVLL